MLEKIKSSKKLLASLIIAVVLFVILLSCGAVYSLAVRQTKVTGFNLTLPESMAKGETAAVVVDRVYTVPDWLPESIVSKLREKYVDGLPVIYTSSDNAILAVDNTGAVTAVSDGKATVTVQLGKLIQTSDVTVSTPITQINADDQVFVRQDGQDTATANITVVPSDADASTLAYSIEDTSIATVDSSGTVTGVSNGKTNLVITAPSGVTKTIPVISAYFVTDFNLSEEDVTIKTGEYVVLDTNIVGQDPDGNVWRSDVQWDVSDKSIVMAVPSPDFNTCSFYAVSPGSTTATATVLSTQVFTDTCKITVTAASTSNKSVSTTTKSSGSATTKSSGTTSSASTSGTSGNTSAAAGGTTAPAANTTVTPVAAPAPAPAVTAYMDTGAAQSALSIINEYRASKGLYALVWSDSLAGVAQGRAQQLPGDYSHNGWPGDTNECINEILSGADASTCVSSWENSPTHNDILLHDGATQCGLACYVDSNGVGWWVLESQ